MPEGFQISAYPKIGPEGLALEHFPETVRPMSVLDVLETLRWIHADLRQIHVAFRGVFEVQREMASIRGIHTLQKAQFQKYAGASKEIEKALSAQLDRIDDAAKKSLGSLLGEIDTSHRRIEELSQSLTASREKQRETNERADKRFVEIENSIVGAGDKLAQKLEDQFQSYASIVQDLDKRLAALSLIVDGRLSGQSNSLQEVSDRLSGLEASIPRNLQEVSSRINEEIEQNQQAQQLVSGIVNNKLNTLLDRQSGLEAWLRRPWWKKIFGIQ